MTKEPSLSGHLYCMNVPLRPVTGNTYLVFITAALRQQAPAALVDVHSAVCQAETQQRSASAMPGNSTVQARLA